MKKYILFAAIVFAASACTAKTTPTPNNSSQNNQQNNPPASAMPTQTPPPATTMPAAPVKTAPAPTGTATILQNQVWSSGQARVTIGTDSTQVEMACSSGIINTPFRVDASGNFTLNGDYYPPGPPRAVMGANGQEQGQDYSAMFSGSISGTTMQLTITPKEFSSAQSFTVKKQDVPLAGGVACPL